MQLTCPGCGEEIPAANINIQQMAAVCPACATVFQFEISDRKTVQRKMKAPKHLSVYEEDDHLNLAFRTNFRLDQNEAFLTSGIMGAMLTFVSVLLASKLLAGGIALLLPAGFIFATLLLYYWLALIVYNKTHIEIGEDKIRVSRRPLPNLLDQTNITPLSGIVKFEYEETPKSKKEGYDTPRYRIWAETSDGRRKAIINDLIDDYAIYITQTLNDHLSADPDVSRLVDTEHVLDNHQSPDEFSQQPQHR